MAPRYGGVMPKKGGKKSWPKDMACSGVVMKKKGK